MLYRVVIFDFDGTLADSFPWFSSILNEVADRYRFRRIEGHEIEGMRTLGARDLMRHLGISRWKLPLIARHMRQRLSKESHRIHLFAGVDRMLRRLSEAGIAAAVVSSNSESNVRAVLGPANASLIRYYGCGASLLGKASLFRKVLRQSNTAASDALYIGDEIRDFEAAREAGLAFGAVTWGYTAPDALIALAPTHVFHAMDEIADRLIR